MLLVTGAQLTRMSGGGLALAGKGSSSGERGISSTGDHGPRPILYHKGTNKGKSPPV